MDVLPRIRVPYRDNSSQAPSLCLASAIPLRGRSVAKGISLHVGLNSVDPGHYQGWSGPLQACEADANSMEEVAEKQGFETARLKTRNATRHAVEAGISKAARTLEEGDMFLLSYSGHGGQVKDENSDEPDLVDETWCLYDGQLVDDELWHYWSGFKAGVRILVISDSCHSGTVTRFRPDRLASHAPSGARFMPMDVALKVYHKNREFYSKIQKLYPSELKEPEATVRLISGCQDHQYSLDGTFNGLFTSVLTLVWDDGAYAGGKGGNYADFHRKILNRMPEDQQPNHYVIGRPNREYDRQRPFSV